MMKGSTKQAKSILVLGRCEKFRRVQRSFTRNVIGEFPASRLSLIEFIV